MGTAFVDFGESVTCERVRMLRETAQQLLSLADELESEIGKRLVGHETGLILAELSEKGPAESSAEAEKIYQMRRLRESYFPADFFGEAAWDMLLDLFARNASGKPVSVSSACIAASVPATTALRWLRLLESRGFVERSQHSKDSRVTLIGLTEFGRSQLKSYLRNIG